MTDQGFSKGQSDNLPKVDMFMVASFIQNSERFSLGEVRGVKAEKFFNFYPPLALRGDICRTNGGILYCHPTLVTVQNLIRRMQDLRTNIVTTFLGASGLDNIRISTRLEIYKNVSLDRLKEGMAAMDIKRRLSEHP